MTSLWVRIGGIPATEIGPHAPPAWETLADGGCGQASIAFALHGRAQHQVLKAGALMEIMCGLGPVWKGLLTEPDRTTWEIHGVGLSAALRRRLALDATGAVTRNLTTALTEAINRGWQGWNPTPISGPVAGDADGNPITVGQLLDEYAEQTGQRWGVDATGAVYMRPDPTAPTWLAAPDSAAFGTTNEDTPTMLAGRYFNGTTYETAYAGGGDYEEAVDLSAHGTLSGPAAEAMLAGMLERTGGIAWTNGTTLTRDQLTTTGGQRAFLPGVLGGQMMRAHGLSYGIAAQSFGLDTVIGRTKYDAAEPDEIFVEPVNTAPRTLSDVIAATA